LHGTRKMQYARDRKDRRKNLGRKNHTNKAWKLEVEKPLRKGQGETNVEGGGRGNLQTTLK
jgi:hypothetical protein